MCTGCSGKQIKAPIDTHCTKLAVGLMKRHHVEIDRVGVGAIKKNSDMLLRFKELLIDVRTTNEIVEYDVGLLNDLCLGKKDTEVGQ